MTFPGWDASFRAQDDYLRANGWAPDRGSWRLTTGPRVIIATRLEALKIQRRKDTNTRRNREMTDDAKLDADIEASIRRAVNHGINRNLSPVEGRILLAEITRLRDELARREGVAPDDGRVTVRLTREQFEAVRLAGGARDAALVEAGQACVDWFKDHAGKDCHLCGPRHGKHDEGCPLEHFEDDGRSQPAPVVGRKK